MASVALIPQKRFKYWENSDLGTYVTVCSQEQPPNKKQDLQTSLLQITGGFLKQTWIFKQLLETIFDSYK